MINKNEMKLKKQGMENYMWHESSPLFDTKLPKPQPII